MEILTMNDTQYNTMVNEVAELIADLIPTIADDYRATDGLDDDVPGMAVTIASDDCETWTYQTGDNSYSGGCYGYHHWGVGTVYRDSDPKAVAEDLVEDLAEQFWS